ncbi:sensor histidine kinase [Roseibacillus persicicus]|uniref:sensor histidine kinase n=1 Tax=Roseibacillus persicicus TaxID=454148 RepID=UPI00280DB9B6|nr:HAMP domain-containing sensor histidine kinase [Roseibacillus persicicus]MDQ8192153.1 HAMP domain-containing sensor histidine kinase [Roseibacillus persicicus]
MFSLFAKSEDSNSPENPSSGITSDVLNFPEGPSTQYVQDLMLGFVHKHNNFLTITQGYADLMLSGSLREDHERNLTTIAKSARNAVELNARVMACASKDLPQFEKVELRSFLQEREMRIKQVAGEQNCEAIIELGHEDGDVHTDPFWLDIILSEVVQNACEASNASRITVTLLPDSEPKSGRILEIHDNGDGISEETLSKVFTPFFSTKGREHMGIGLTRAGSLAAKLGALIKIESSSPGTTVLLSLPPQA